MRNIFDFVFKLMLTLALMCVAVPSFPALELPDSDLSWRNISVNGKKTAVFCLFKDSRGIMWLGTNRGLFFYDGVTAHLVGGTGVFGTQVYAIVEKDNSLYVGSNNGLLVYDYESGNIAPGVVVPAPKEIRALLLVDDSLWIGGLDGIYLLDLADNSVINYSKGLPHKSVYSILRDSRGIIYAGTYGGLARWDSQAEMFHAVKIRNSERQVTLFANCLLESHDKESIFIGGEGYLYRYFPANEHWEKVMLVEDYNIKSLAKSESGHIFIGTDDGVFDFYDGSIKHYRHDSRYELSLADNEIWCIYADRQHNVWTGHERGLSIASNSTSMRTIKLSALVHCGEGNEIHSIHRDSKGNLWLGGTNGVIRISSDYTPDWYRHSKNRNSLSHNKVRAILEDSDHTLWFATDGGINRYNPQEDNFDVFHIVDNEGRHNSNWVYALVEDGDYLWIGSFLSGIHYVRKDKLRESDTTVLSDLSINQDNSNTLGLGNDLINDMVRDKAGNIWILLFRENVLTKYNPLTNKTEKYDIFDMAGGYPTDICMDKTGRVWCAFTGGAVVFNDKGYKILKFPHANSDETVLALAPVGDDMWISTQSNVWRVNGNNFGATLLPLPQKSYTAVYEDALSNKVYLGGTDEILVVDNDIDVKTGDYKSIKMAIKANGDGNLQLNDVMEGTRGITLPYGGSISLIVSSLDYSPEKVQRYMYKLASSPADTVDGWIVMPENANSIAFSDLKMGEYNVLVKLLDSPAASVAIPLTVKPPLALSRWAIMLYALLIIGIIYSVVWYTKRKNIRTFQEQERQTALENVERKLSFLSTISHDLKTPLSMILGPVSLMKERAANPEDKKSLGMVYDNAVRLNNMIHRTLELQHLEDNAEHLLINSIFNVVDFCKNVFEVFKENNQQKHFVFHASSQQIYIEADAVKFESVITNLLSNACKYSDGGATISCGISQHGGMVEIAVADDGVGISEADQPLVFQRMFRAPATSKLKEGTGLGLYLIKKYLELMKGDIRLYSKEGQGTSFIITLPISEKALQTHQAVSTDDGSKPKVLIVEDNMQIQDFIIDIIKGSYTYLTAANGRSGLAIASSFIPDLIIVDEMMPIMNGLEMARQIKHHPRLSSIPLIMLTAKTDNQTENESIKIGIDAFMTKPFEPKALLGRMSQLLKSRSEIKEKVRIQAITEAEAKPIEAESANEKALAKIAKIIEENVSDPDLNVNLLCEKSGINPKQLYRLVKKYIGLSPLDYIRRVRLQKAAVLLSQHRFTVSEISYMVGFKTPSYFTKCFQSHYGVKPSQYHSDDETVS